MKHRLSLLALAAAAILGLAAAATATSFIRLEQPGFAPVEVSASFYVDASFQGNYGTYEWPECNCGVIAWMWEWRAPEFFWDTYLSDILVSSEAAGTHELTISVSRTDITIPSSRADFVSYFSPAHDMPEGWILTIDTFLNPSNAPYGTAIPLGSINSSIGSPNFIHLVLDLPADPYSITSIYRLTSVGPGVGGGYAITS